MAKSIGAQIAEQFKRGDRELADAIDAAIVDARTQEARAWREKLSAAVVECGSRRGSGPHRLPVSQRSIRAVTPQGHLSETELPSGGLLISYTPPDPAQRKKG